jgi:ribonucleoside-diphosphate reductase alpha chain
MNVYTSAWDKGLKTTYYLHMKPRHTAEQSTISVNKAEALGKRGFAALRDKPKEEAPVENVATVTAPEFVATASPLIMPKMETMPKLNIHVSEDPQDQFLCEGCQ